MNKSIIESIEWHKNCLFKLLEDDDLYKEEGNIYSVKTELNGIIEKAKSKKRVWVKPTATKKGYYREQEVGRKEGEGKGPGMLSEGEKGLVGRSRGAYIGTESYIDKGRVLLGRLQESSSDDLAHNVKEMESWRDQAVKFMAKDVKDTKTAVKLQEAGKIDSEPSTQFDASASLFEDFIPVITGAIDKKKKLL